MKYLLMVVLLFSFNQAIARTADVYYDGNKLLGSCESYISKIGIAAKGNVCFGYVIGIADADTTLIYEDIRSNRCIPFKVGGNQLVRVVTKYLQEHPDRLHMAAPVLVSDALSEAFPCYSE